MDQNLKKALERVKKLSDAELRSDVGTYREGSPQHATATTELAHRESKRAFWRKDIVAWIALGVAVLSLILSFISLRRS